MASTLPSLTTMPAHLTGGRLLVPEVGFSFDLCYQFSFDLCYQLLPSPTTSRTLRLIPYPPPPHLCLSAGHHQVWQSLRQAFSSNFSSRAARMSIPCMSRTRPQEQRLDVKGLILSQLRFRSKRQCPSCFWLPPQSVTKGAGTSSGPEPLRSCRR